MWAEIAERIAREAHRGQVDKVGRPYIEHPQRVASAVAGDDMLVAIAWMHDVVEDTATNLDELQQMFPSEITAAVDAITKRPEETRAQYYARVRQNPRALRVKHADIDDNTSPARVALLDEQTQKRLAAKYERARAELTRV